MSNTISPETARDWLAARKVIATAMAEWFPRLSGEDVLRYADAIQARLAHANLLAVHMDRLGNGDAK